MSKKSFQERIPSEFKEIQLNFCRTPICENFGVEELPQDLNLHEKDKNATPPKRADKLYNITGIVKDDSAIKCKACAKLKTENPFRRQPYHTIKSNRAA